MHELAYVAVGLGGVLFGAAGGFAWARRSASGTAPIEPEPAPVEPPCRVPGCREGARLRELCRRHYGKAYRLHILDALGEAELLRLAEDKRFHPRERPPLRMVSR